MPDNTDTCPTPTDLTEYKNGKFGKIFINILFKRDWLPGHKTSFLKGQLEERFYIFI